MSQFPNSPQPPYTPQPVYAPQGPTAPYYGPSAPQAPQAPQGPTAPQAPAGHRYQAQQRGRALSTGHVNAISWKEAQPGDTYEGHFLRLERSSFAPYNHGIVLQTGDGSEVLLRGTGRLENFLRNHRPQPGQYFVFTLLGKETIAKGKFAGNKINEFDVQIVDENDMSSETRFQNIASSVNAEYAIMQAQAAPAQQPAPAPYGYAQQAQPPPYYAQPQPPPGYAPQPAYQPQPPPQYAPQPAYQPQPPPQYAPQPPPQYAPQQPPQTYGVQQPYNPNEVPF